MAVVLFSVSWCKHTFYMIHTTQDTTRSRRGGRSPSVGFDFKNHPVLPSKHEPCHNPRHSALNSVGEQLQHPDTTTLSDAYIHTYVYYINVEPATCEASKTTQQNSAWPVGFCTLPSNTPVSPPLSCTNPYPYFTHL
jgi:hypothetical protein